MAEHLVSAGPVTGPSQRPSCPVPPAEQVQQNRPAGQGGNRQGRLRGGRRRLAALQLDFQDALLAALDNGCEGWAITHLRSVSLCQRSQIVEVALLRTKELVEQVVQSGQSGFAAGDQEDKFRPVAVAISRQSAGWSRANAKQLPQSEQR